MKTSPSAQASHSEELVNVPVPRRHYALVIQVLARAIAEEAGTGASAELPTTRHPWTPEEVAQLRELASNPTVRNLMEMTCARPGVKVAFPDVYEKAGRTYHQARADLAGLTKLIWRRFRRENWPVNVSQRSDGILTYDADPAVSEAWKSASRK